MEFSLITKEIKEEVFSAEGSFLNQNMANERYIRSWGDIDWTCYYCSDVFGDYESLQSHILMIHKISNPDNVHYQCDDCKALLFSYAAFVNHIRSTHYRSLKKSCDVCSLIFTNYKQLSYHRLGHKKAIQPIVYQCMQCDIVKRTQRQLRAHVQDSHYEAFAQQESQLRLLRNKADPLEVSQSSSYVEDAYSSLDMNPCKDEFFEVTDIYQCGKCNKNCMTEGDLECHNCALEDISVDLSEGEQFSKTKGKNHKRRQKRKANWSHGAEILLCDAWEQKIENLRNTRRTWHIYDEIRQILAKKGCPLTILEIQTKIHNLTSRYRVEKSKVDSNGVPSSDWSLYPKVHRILGSSKKSKNAEIGEESTGSSDKKTETENSNKNDLPDVTSDDTMENFRPFLEKFECSEPKYMKINETTEDLSQITEENSEVCETPDKLSIKIYEEKVKQTKLMQKMYEEETKKTKLMEQFVKDNSEFKNAFLKFLSQRN